VAFRIAGDADLGKVVPELGHCSEEWRRSREAAGRLLRVPRHHEEVAHAHPRDAVEQLAQVGLVANEAGREVRDDLEPVSGETLGELERRAEAQAGRNGHRHLHVTRHVRENVVLDARQRDHLVSRPLEQGEENVGDVSAAAVLEDGRADARVSRRGTPPPRRRPQPPAWASPSPGR
jgi:hypothetical protein